MRTEKKTLQLQYTEKIEIERDIYIYLFIYLYIYIYRERERDRLRALLNEDQSYNAEMRMSINR